MNEEQIKRQFSHKIRKNYEDFLKERLSQEPEKMASYAEEISAPSKEHLSTLKGPLTVRELLELYPDDSFDIMTPGGFVYLTPEKSREMLAGSSTVGNPGCSGCDMAVTAKELLPQKIQSASCENGTWHFLSCYEPEMEQQPTAMEPGVTMC